MTDPLDLIEAAQPRCEDCGTVMRDIEGGYTCGSCGATIRVAPSVRPDDGDDLPSIG